MRFKQLSVILLMIALSVIVPGCQTEQIPGTFEGTVTIGPIQPFVRPGEQPPVPPQVFEARKIIVYNKSKTRIVQTVGLKQIGQSDKASFSVQLNPGSYVVDINRIGIDNSRDVPTIIQIQPGQIVVLDIDIDTGIR